jgi:ribosomal protein S6--L-glutamate ligase
LTVSTGYGVAELQVREASHLLGKTIEEAFEDRDIAVLTLTRGTTVIPNPRSSRELQPDDRLLCFGRLDGMRDLVPERRRRRALPEIQPLPDDALPDPEST